TLILGSTLEYVKVDVVGTTDHRFASRSARLSRSRIPLLVRTTSGSTGPVPAGYCFVCNCERVMVAACGADCAAGGGARFAGSCVPQPPESRSACWPARVPQLANRRSRRLLSMGER